MKKALMFMVFAVAMSSTTGCAAKKRVKALEAELSRCRQKKASLSENTQQQPADTTVAEAAVRPE